MASDPRTSSALLSPTHCPDCGQEYHYYTALGMRSPVEHACPMRGPETAAEGAAVAFGLMGMAEAIRGGQWGEIDRCVECWCPNLLHFSFCSKHRDNREQRT